MHPESNNKSKSDDNASFLRAARGGNLEKVLEYLKHNTDINSSNANGLNALHLASKEGHVDIVRELLSLGSKIDAATKKGNTALHIASLAGQEEVVRILVENSASVNVQSQNGFTPLYMAAQENHDAVVRFLLASGANQSLATEDGFTPLAVALQQGHDKVVAVLLENDSRGKARLPALHIAAKKDDVKAAGLLLQNDHNPDVTSKSGFTPLHISAHYGNENVAVLLLQRNANVNYAAKHNITPLHVAAKWGKVNMVALLLDKGAALEAKTRDGLTPLHCAARSGHENVVDMMIQRGAPISAKTKNGLAPLHMASQGDHVDAARILVHHKAPVDEVTVDYLTALHVAAHCGHVRVAKLLLDRKADPNSRALNGFTPLHIACKKNRLKVVELLLKYGASIEATTESGLTPLHVASFMGCMNIVIYLLQHSASPDEATVRGETPLHLAARANQTDIIRILLRNGAKVDARAREQQTPLHIASRLGNVDIVVLLLQSGAQVDATTKDLYTALHIAAKEGQEEVAGVLLDHNASKTASTKKGFTPLHLAAKYGNKNICKLLLQKNAPVDCEGKNGVTPLHVAAHYDHPNVALLFLDSKASPHSAAKNGYTPLHITSKKNQREITKCLLDYGASTNAESKAGFTPLHLAAQEGHIETSKILVDNKANVNAKAKNGLSPIHLCSQEDQVAVAEILKASNANLEAETKAGYTPLQVACHFGSAGMVKFLLENDVDVNKQNAIGYSALHQASQQGHTQIVNLLLANGASPNSVSNNGQTALSIAQRLGYISVVETLKIVTLQEVTTTTTTTTEEKYKVLAPESMQETFMSDSEDDGGEETMIGDNTYKYLTVDEMKSLGDDSMPIDVTHDEKNQSTLNRADYQSAANELEEKISSALAAAANNNNNNINYQQKATSSSSSNDMIYSQTDNVPLYTPVNVGNIDNKSTISLATSIGTRSVTSMWRERFLVSFMVDARGGAMRGCRHSGVRVIIPPRKAPMPMRITCRYLRKDKLIHPPPLMEGEAIASRILELGPTGAKFLGPVIIEVPHFASLRGKEREIVILRSDNGESWREHTLEATEDAVQDVLQESFDGDDVNQLEDLNTNRITRILTTDFPQYFAIISRIRQEVHAIGPEGGMVNSTVIPQVQAVFPPGALTKKIKVGLQAQPIPTELVTKLLGNRVAVSPIVTVEPRRRKFHKPITLTMPFPQASGKGMINNYNADKTPTLRLLCSITGGTTRAQWEDVTGSTPPTFVNDCVNFTTTVSARFWLIDCRNVQEVTKMATELYREAIHVPFMAKFLVYCKRHEVNESRLRVFCITDDKEDKTLENQEHFVEIAKSRDVEVLEGKSSYLEFGGNLVPVTKSGEQLSLRFHAFRENRLPFVVRVKDPDSELMGRIAFMKESKVYNNVQQTPICNLNIDLPDSVEEKDSHDVNSLHRKHVFLKEAGYGKFDTIHRADLRISDIGNMLGSDWVRLARNLGISEADINIIKSEFPENEGQQAMVMLRLWLNLNENKATGNELERALLTCGRVDIIKSCMFNLEMVTDTNEKTLAQKALNQTQDETQTENTITNGDKSDISRNKEEATSIYEEEEQKYIAEEKEIRPGSPVDLQERLSEEVEVKKEIYSEEIHSQEKDDEITTFTTTTTTSKDESSLSNFESTRIQSNEINESSSVTLQNDESRLSDHEVPLDSTDREDVSPLLNPPCCSTTSSFPDTHTAAPSEMSPYEHKNFTFVEPVIMRSSLDELSQSLEHKAIPSVKEETLITNDKLVTYKIRGEILDSELNQTEESIMSDCKILIERDIKSSSGTLDKSSAEELASTIVESVEHSAIERAVSMTKIEADEFVQKVESSAIEKAMSVVKSEANDFVQKIEISAIEEVRTSQQCEVEERSETEVESVKKVETSLETKVVTMSREEAEAFIKKMGTSSIETSTVESKTSGISKSNIEEKSVTSRKFIINEKDVTVERNLSSKEIRETSTLEEDTFKREEYNRQITVNDEQPVQITKKTQKMSESVGNFEISTIPKSFDVDLDRECESSIYISKTDSGTVNIKEKVFDIESIKISKDKDSIEQKVHYGDTPEIKSGAPFESVYLSDVEGLTSIEKYSDVTEDLNKSTKPVGIEVKLIEKKIDRDKTVINTGEQTSSAVGSHSSVIGQDITSLLTSKTMVKEVDSKVILDLGQVCDIEKNVEIPTDSIFEKDNRLAIIKKIEVKDISIKTDSFSDGDQIVEKPTSHENKNSISITDSEAFSMVKEISPSTIREDTKPDNDFAKKNIVKELSIEREIPNISSNNKIDNETNSSTITFITKEFYTSDQNSEIEDAKLKEKNNEVSPVDNEEASSEVESYRSSGLVENKVESSRDLVSETLSTTNNNEEIRTNIITTIIRKVTDSSDTCDKSSDSENVKNVESVVSLPVTDIDIRNSSFTKVESRHEILNSEFFQTNRECNQSFTLQEKEISKIKDTDSHNAETERCSKEIKVTVKNSATPEIVDDRKSVTEISSHDMSSSCIDDQNIVCSTESAELSDFLLENVVFTHKTIMTKSMITEDGDTISIGEVIHSEQFGIDLESHVGECIESEDVTSDVNIGHTMASEYSDTIEKGFDRSSSKENFVDVNTIKDKVEDYESSIGKITSEDVYHDTFESFPPTAGEDGENANINTLKEPALEKIEITMDSTDAGISSNLEENYTKSSVMTTVESGASNTSGVILYGDNNDKSDKSATAEVVYKKVIHVSKETRQLYVDHDQSKEDNSSERKNQDNNESNLFTDKPKEKPITGIDSEVVDYHETKKLPIKKSKEIEISLNDENSTATSFENRGISQISKNDCLVKSERDESFSNRVVSLSKETTSEIIEEHERSQSEKIETVQYKESIEMDRKDLFIQSSFDTTGVESLGAQMEELFPLDKALKDTEKYEDETKIKDRLIQTVMADDFASSISSTSETSHTVLKPAEDEGYIEERSLEDALIESNEERAKRDAEELVHSVETDALKKILGTGSRVCVAQEQEVELEEASHFQVPEKMEAVEKNEFSLKKQQDIEQDISMTIEERSSILMTEKDSFDRYSAEDERQGFTEGVSASGVSISFSSYVVERRESDEQYIPQEIQDQWKKSEDSYPSPEEDHISFTSYNVARVECIDAQDEESEEFLSKKDEKVDSSESASDKEAVIIVEPVMDSMKQVVLTTTVSSDGKDNNSSYEKDNLITERLSVASDLRSLSVLERIGDKYVPCREVERYSSPKHGDRKVTTVITKVITTKTIITTTEDGEKHEEVICSTSFLNGNKGAPIPLLEEEADTQKDTSEYFDNDEIQCLEGDTSTPENVKKTNSFGFITSGVSHFVQTSQGNFSGSANESDNRSLTRSDVRLEHLLKSCIPSTQDDGSADEGEKIGFTDEVASESRKLVESFEGELSEDKALNRMYDSGCIEEDSLKIEIYQIKDNDEQHELSKKKMIFEESIDFRHISSLLTHVVKSFDNFVPEFKDTSLQSGAGVNIGDEDAINNSKSHETSITTRTVTTVIRRGGGDDETSSGISTLHSSSGGTVFKTYESTFDYLREEDTLYAAKEEDDDDLTFQEHEVFEVSEIPQDEARAVVEFYNDESSEGDGVKHYATEGEVEFPYCQALDQILEETEEELQVQDVSGRRSKLIPKDLDFSSTKKKGKDEESSSLSEFEKLERDVNSIRSSQDSLEIVKRPSSSSKDNDSLIEFETTEAAAQELVELEKKAKYQEEALSEIEEGHESQISSCETISENHEEILHAEDDITISKNFDVIFQTAAADTLSGRIVNIMENSVDSLEEEEGGTCPNTPKHYPAMDQSVDSLEEGKKNHDSSSAMITSTDSLESCSVNTRATASMLSSATSDTLIQDLNEDCEFNNKDRYYQEAKRLLLQRGELDIDYSDDSCSTEAVVTSSSPLVTQVTKIVQNPVHFTEVISESFNAPPSIPSPSPPTSPNTRGYNGGSKLLILSSSSSSTTSSTTITTNPFQSSQSDASNLGFTASRKQGDKVHESY